MSIFPLRFESVLKQGVENQDSVPTIYALICPKGIFLQPSINVTRESFGQSMTSIYFSKVNKK